MYTDVYWSLLTILRKRLEITQSYRFDRTNERRKYRSERKISWGEKYRYLSYFRKSFSFIEKLGVFIRLQSIWLRFIWRTDLYFKLFHFHCIPYVTEIRRIDSAQYVQYIIFQSFISQKQCIIFNSGYFKQNSWSCFVFECISFTI